MTTIGSTLRSLAEVAAQDISAPPDLISRVSRVTRQRKRRHRILVAVAASTGTAAAVAAVAVLPSVLASLSPSEHPTDSNGSFAESGPAAVVAPHRREVMVPQEGIADVFATFYPGDITKHPAKEPGLPYAAFLWNGFEFRIGFSKAEYNVSSTAVDPETGEPIFGDWTTAGTPLERCERSIDNPADCRSRPDGSATRTYSEDLTARGGEAMSAAYVYTLDGWDITVFGTSNTPPAPLSPRQLLRVAESNIWFEPTNDR